MQRNFIFFHYLTVFFIIISLSKAYSDTLDIPDIQVQNDQSTSNSSSSANGIDVSFTQDDLQQQGATTTSEFLENQSILQVTTSSSQQDQTAISMRGFGNNASSNTLILVDGLPLTSFTSIGPNINTILVDNIDKINILPGSYGSLYGNQAVGGVVDITTHTPAERLITSGISMGNNAQAQTYGFYSERYPSNLGVSLGAMATTTDHDQPHNDQNNYNINAKVDYLGSYNTTSLNLLSFHNYLQLPQAKNYNTGALIPSMAQSSEITNTIAYLTNQYQFNDNLSLKSDGMYIDANTKAELTNSATNNSIDQTGGFIQNELHYLDYVNLGFNLQQNHYNNVNSLHNNTADETTYAIYDHFKLPIPYVKKLKLILGSRYATQYLTAEGTDKPIKNNDTDVFVYSAGLLYQQTPHLDYYLRRDTNFRFVKGNELFMTSDGSINTNLNAQTGASNEAGISYHKGANQLQLSTYILNLDNELAYDPTIGTFGQMSNLPPTQRIGSDFNFQTYFNQYVGINTQLSYVDAKIVSGDHKGNQIPAVSPFNALIALMLNYHNWSIYLNESYHSSFYASNDIDNQGPKMPGYFLTNCTIEKSWQYFSINLRVLNLFNQPYVRYADFYSSDDINYYAGDGISILVSLTFHLS
ncbi:TonB-dependent receptor [Thiotrichales bacterium 19S3-7]|nr:TonB-dependent receptor [Thiotrichales bacterium 19S3-7]MCF6801633.1 TonB-dependent receptor [Thiotrichales bacterium 19S3-11]